LDTFRGWRGDASLGDDAAAADDEKKRTDMGKKGGKKKSSKGGGGGGDDEEKANAAAEVGPTLFQHMTPAKRRDRASTRRCSRA